MGWKCWRKTPKYQRKVQNSSEFLCRWQRRPEQKLRLKESRKVLCRTFYAKELWIVAQRSRQTWKISTFRHRSRLLVKQMTSLWQKRQIELADKSFAGEWKIAGNRRQSQQWNFCAAGFWITNFFQANSPFSGLELAWNLLHALAGLFVSVKIANEIIFARIFSAFSVEWPWVVKMRRLFAFKPVKCVRNW